MADCTLMPRGLWPSEQGALCHRHAVPRLPGNQRPRADRRTNMKPRHLVVAIPLAFLPSACGQKANEVGDDASSSAWGRLAVVSGPPTGMEASRTGQLVVTERCVTLLHAGSDEEVLLIWPSEATTWNSSSSTIGYTPRGRAFEFSHGDELDVGGGGSSSTEGGPSSMSSSLPSTTGYPSPTLHASPTSGGSWVISDRRMRHPGNAPPVPTVERSR